MPKYSRRQPASARATSAARGRSPTTKSAPIARSAAARSASRRTRARTGRPRRSSPSTTAPPTPPDSPRSASHKDQTVCRHDDSSPVTVVGLPHRLAGPASIRRTGRSTRSASESYTKSARSCFGTDEQWDRAVRRTARRRMPVRYEKLCPADRPSCIVSADGTPTRPDGPIPITAMARCREPQPAPFCRSLSCCRLEFRRGCRNHFSCECAGAMIPG